MIDNIYPLQKFKKNPVSMKKQGILVNGFIMLLLFQLQEQFF